MPIYTVAEVFNACKNSSWLPLKRLSRYCDTWSAICTPVAVLWGSVTGGEIPWVLCKTSESAFLRCTLSYGMPPTAARGWHFCLQFSCSRPWQRVIWECISRREYGMYLIYETRFKFHRTTVRQARRPLVATRSFGTVIQLGNTSRNSGLGICKLPSFIPTWGFGLK